MIFSEGDNATGQWLTLRILREKPSIELLAADETRAVYLVQ
jgi:hypothetical protein